MEKSFSRQDPFESFSRRDPLNTWRGTYVFQKQLGSWFHQSRWFSRGKTLAKLLDNSDIRSPTHVLLDDRPVDAVSCSTSATQRWLAVSFLPVNCSAALVATRRGPLSPPRYLSPRPHGTGGPWNAAFEKFYWIFGAPAKQKHAALSEVKTRHTEVKIRRDTVAISAGGVTVDRTSVATRRN